MAPAMEVVGGNEERDGRVWATCGRERGRRGSRGMPGQPYVTGPRLTVDAVYGHPWKWPRWPREEARGCLRRSWAWSKSGDKERGSGDGSEASRV